MGDRRHLPPRVGGKRAPGHVTVLERVGVFGGTFDPVHIGHLAVAQDVAHQLGLDRVLIVPNHQPPHKQGQPVTDVADRVAMVQLAAADNASFQVSRVELERPGPSYTLDTMRELQLRLGSGSELYFLVGSDALPDLHTWHEPEKLLEEFRVVVMDRPTEQGVDWAVVEARFPNIRNRVQMVSVAQLVVSGVNIRMRVRNGQPIRYYVAPAVERYIFEHNLYR